MCLYLSLYMIVWRLMVYTHVQTCTSESMVIIYIILSNDIVMLCPLWNYATTFPLTSFLRCACACACVHTHNTLDCLLALSLLTPNTSPPNTLKRLGDDLYLILLYYSLHSPPLQPFCKVQRTTGWLWLKHKLPSKFIQPFALNCLKQYCFCWLMLLSDIFWQNCCQNPPSDSSFALGYLKSLSR